MTTFNGVLEAATQNASNSNEIAIAAGQVFARRVALGVTAAFDPLAVDHTEFGRMVPEKMRAFSAAGMIMLAQTSQAGWEITRLASDEFANTAQATLAMSHWINPIAVAEAQGQFARDWINRATSNFFTMALLALDAQQAGMAPIHETIACNAERLAR